MIQNQRSDCIGRNSEQLIKVTKDAKFCGTVKLEYSMLMREDLIKENETYESDHDICKCCSSISKKEDALGHMKYSSISKLIKSCLSLSYGNSIPERGFSVNNNIVTDERNSVSEIGIK